MTQIWADSQSAESTHSRRPLRRRWCGLPQQFKTNWLALSFVQRPSDGWRLLTPELRGGEAVWVDPSLAVWCRRSAHCATDPSDDRCAGADRHGFHARMPETRKVLE